MSPEPAPTTQDARSAPSDEPDATHDGVTHDAVTQDAVTLEPGPARAADDKPAHDKPADPGRESLFTRLVAVVLLLASIAGFALVTVLRHPAEHLNADGIQQSTMSVQNVDLFYWGQDRLAALTSWLASPIADPTLNLWACLLINATVFYTMLATLARMGVRMLVGSRSWLATLLAFLVLAGAMQVLFTSRTIYILTLEGQPYAWSHLLVLWAFLLWRTRRPLQAVVAALLVTLTVGLNSAAILTLAALSLAAVLLQRRQWFRNLLWWGLLGVVCVAAQGLWMVLASRFGGQAGPQPEVAPPYFSFTVATFMAGWRPVLDNLLDTLRQPTWIALVALAGLAALSLPDVWRPRLRTLLLAGGVFAGLYAGLFMSNAWVAMNGHHFRYFAPTLFFLLLALAAPIALWLIGLTTRPVEAADRANAIPGLERAPRNPALVLLVAVVVGGLGLAAAIGPLRNPNDAYVLEAMEPTADYAGANDIRFISGYYWMMWPALHDSLDDSRTELFIAGDKSGGDVDAYHEAFTEARRSSDGSVEALCVGWSVEQCQEYLEYWTAPGWEDTGRTCPMPADSSPARERQLLGNPTEPTCRVLVNSQDTPLTQH